MLHCNKIAILCGLPPNKRSPSKQHKKSEVEEEDEAKVQPLKRHFKMATIYGIPKGGFEVKEDHKTGSRLESDNQRKRERERASDIPFKCRFM